MFSICFKPVAKIRLLKKELKIGAQNWQIQHLLCVHVIPDFLNRKLVAKQEPQDFKDVEARQEAGCSRLEINILKLNTFSVNSIITNIK